MEKTSNIDKYYYVFPQTVVMVGVRTNVMPAAWHTPISAKPPLYGVLISPNRYTFDLIKKEKGFTINFLGYEHAPLAAKTGSTSGRDINKLTKFNMKFSAAENVNGPVLSNAYAVYECEKHSMCEYGDHFLFTGKIVLIHYRRDIMTGNHVVNEKKMSPMLYFGKDRYITIDPQTLSVHKRG